MAPASTTEAPGLDGPSAGCFGVVPTPRMTPTSQFPSQSHSVAPGFGSAALAFSLTISQIRLRLPVLELSADSTQSAPTPQLRLDLALPPDSTIPTALAASGLGFGLPRSSPTPDSKQPTESSPKIAPDSNFRHLRLHPDIISSLLLEPDGSVLASPSAARPEASPHEAMQAPRPASDSMAPLSLSLCCTPKPDPSPWTILATVVPDHFAQPRLPPVHQRSFRKSREPGLWPLPFGLEESSRAESQAFSLFPSATRSSSPERRAKSRNRAGHFWFRPGSLPSSRLRLLPPQPRLRYVDSTVSP